MPSLPICFLFLRINLIINVIFLFFVSVRFSTLLPNLGFILFLTFGLCYVLFCILSILSAMIGIFKRKKVKAAAPFICNMITFLIVYFLPLGNVGEKIIFASKVKDYESKITQLKMQLKKDSNIKSNSWSQTNIVYYHHNQSDFFAVLIEGFLNNYSAYVYSANDQPPRCGPYLDNVHVTKMQKNWYRIEA